MLYDRGYLKYTGVDFSDKMIEQAGERIRKSNFVPIQDFQFFVHDLRDGIPDVDFDVAVFSETLEHLTDDVAVLSSSACRTTMTRPTSGCTLPRTLSTNDSTRWST